MSNVTERVVREAYLELVDAHSNKYYRVLLLSTGTDFGVVAEYGRIGSSGRRFMSGAKAQKIKQATHSRAVSVFDQTVNSKTKKGYSLLWDKAHLPYQSADAADYVREASKSLPKLTRKEIAEANTWLTQSPDDIVI
jgi:predicted DNA-binding WGR domain protein